MIVTTSLEPSAETVQHAEELSESFRLPLIERRDYSLHELRKKYAQNEILIVSSAGARLEAEGKKPFFFHPNTAAFRIKRLERGDTDTMLAVCQIQPGDQVLDATMGLGADAIILAYGVGAKGRVIGIESERIIGLLVEDGLRHWSTDSAALHDAMQRVEVRVANHFDVLKSMPADSIDVIYFDPMFEETVQSSVGIAGIREWANNHALKEETIAEALRVARRRVVLKEGKAGGLYRQFGFTPYRTRGKQVVYSYKEKGGGE
ncbi:class I SAM-dependent methyltransferase [Brevibacillus ruminantium]|uniref:Class I SAM-dependent methyltransferase n=1 Tax=Brevibacillus ruminantium TaxID=2950604 RepID=A0ABY4WLK3_9BACL|nr:class I SAM-dependent methyltransferase [Brevibacillus ruminantium]USG68038.1 class I SAM-dependent methyltransferase [Brevibacillus ruminantium]